MAQQTDTSFNFSAKLTELDAITNSLDGDVDLDKGIAQYEQGMKLIQELKKYLAEQTNRVEEIRKTYAVESAAPAGEEDDINLDELPF